MGHRGLEIFHRHSSFFGNFLNGIGNHQMRALPAGPPVHIRLIPLGLSHHGHHLAHPVAVFVIQWLCFHGLRLNDRFRHDGVGDTLGLLLLELHRGVGILLVFIALAVQVHHQVLGAVAVGTECGVNEGCFAGCFGVFYGQRIAGHHQRAGDVQPNIIIVHRHAGFLAQLKAVAGVGVDGMGKPGQIGVRIVRLGFLQCLAHEQTACRHQANLAGDVHIAAGILSVNTDDVAVFVLNQLLGRRFGEHRNPKLFCVLEQVIHDELAGVVEGGRRRTQTLGVHHQPGVAAHTAAGHTGSGLQELRLIAAGRRHLPGHGNFLVSIWHGGRAAGAAQGFRQFKLFLNRSKGGEPIKELGHGMERFLHQLMVEMIAVLLQRLDNLFLHHRLGTGVQGPLGVEEL